MKDFNSSSFKDFLEFLRNSRSSFNIAEGIILEKNNYLSFFSNDYLTNIKTTLLTIRKLIFIEEKKVLLFIKENKLSYSSFCKLLTYKIMKTLNIIISELSLVESEMSLIDICYEFIESN